MSTRRISNAKDVVKLDQKVFVKVISVSGQKLSLSMRDVDQDSGKDLLALNKTATFKTRFSGIKDTEEDAVFGSRVPLKRMNSPERWEANQLVASGVLTVKDLYDDEITDTMAYQEEDGEKDVEVELNEDTPVFLRGHSHYSMDMSPVKIFRNPEGSLSRAAALQSALIKERREVRDQQQRSMLDSIPKDLNRPWEDPMPESGERHLAQELRGVGLSAYDMPDWKKDSFGETGSGKTTQVTQYLAEVGYTTKGKIGCTQPRRVAAQSVAKRVAEEFGCRLGEEVGYSIRFEDCTGPETVIKYMTEGMLLMEVLNDENLSQYLVIMLDEAHERTMNTDVLFGLLKGLVKRRPDLKLIVTSAMLDAEKFSAYFFSCNIFTIPGRTFPVEILYTKQPESDYLDAALITVMQIHLTEPEGDILVFLTGQEEIDHACQSLYDRMKGLGKNVPELIILPVYSALPSEMQSRIFEPATIGKRKVVVATNIAEASLTIDGIFYVVDPGFAKQNVYNPKQGLDSLVITPISQASAKQRAGRAGRTGPGRCYRLYTENAFNNEMSPTSIPEIQRVNLGLTTLNLKAMGMNDLFSFDFMDPPPSQALISAMAQLYTLGALDEEGLLTKLGRKMAEFPLEPPLSKMLLASVDLGCSDEIVTIIAMITTGNIFYRPREKQAQADKKKAKFFQPEGDHLSLLAVYEAWTKNFSGPWCFENFVQSRSLRRAQDVRKQLLSIMDRYKLDVASAGKNFTKIQKAITAGFFFHAARKDPQEGYRTIVENQPVYIHPSSALFQRQPDWVIYHELVMTTKEYMREVAVVDPKWLIQLAPRFFKDYGMIVGLTLALEKQGISEVNCMTMIDMVYLTPSNLINATRTPCLSDSTLKQRLPINNRAYTLTLTLTLNSTRRRIKLEMAAGDSTTSANLDQNPGQFSGVEQKRIIIQNNCGEKLVGLLHETGSKEIVILCHGFRDSKDYSMMVELAFALEKSGISAFRFDFSGNGESEGLFEFGNYSKEVDDLQAVIQHFTTKNRVISAILGHSKGGNVVVLHASLHHDIRTVVNVSGRYKMDRGIEERLGKDYLERAKIDGFIDIKSKKGELLFRVTVESLMERLNTNMHEAGHKVDQDCRVLTVHGSVDEVIPVEDALEFAKIIPNHELRIIEGANHNYNHHRDELVSVVLAFLKDNMHRA
ncbi:hypothetical protein L1987_50167 [Smallanthus sonchifolius]|uniref:Uncharacterized protein n=1 Tax=Smallanthus sonchifolius TaxID=185202 RepID=A0ACB9FXB0_9ASTR|nr:hypothetical protein L1987_50167 [Smallanthus sonchifolius]